jgi:competence protein ComEC
MSVTMSRKIILLLVIMFLAPALASAETAVFHAPSDSQAPYEPVPVLKQPPFAEDAGLLCVDFLDHGAADCILLRCGGESLLVDGGKYHLRDHLLRVFAYLGLTHFTYMLNTHAHDDHIEGLISLLKRDYTPDEYMSCYPDGYTGSEYQTRVRELLSEKNVPYRLVADGDRFTLGGAAVTVYRDETPNIDKNRHSVILKVVFGQRSALLMADAGDMTQDYLLDRYDPGEFKADVLKYPHHGYVNMRYAFLSAVDPEVCVITNSRGSAELADRQLTRRGTPRYYTNQGVVRMQTDGRTWYVEQMPWAWPPDADPGAAL